MTRTGETLTGELLAMAAADLALRDELVADGSLFDGYHPAMRALHEANADRLAAIIAAHGWPSPDQVGPDQVGPDQVGDEASKAAWLVVQHAISRPALMRQVRDLTRGSPAIAAAHWAMLDDRIAVFEGRPQVHGTQFDWDDAGLMSPLPIADPPGIDTRRAEVGLPPLAEATARHRAAAGEPQADRDRHRQGAEAFAREVGWRGAV